MSDKAKESSHIQKARKKIQQRLTAADKKVNEETLGNMSRLIKMQLNRQKPSRIDLKERQITSIDENARYAKIESQFIIKLIHEIEQENPPTDHGLEGRIKTISDKNP